MYNRFTIPISYCIENNVNEVSIIVQIILKTVNNFKSKPKLKRWTTCVLIWVLQRFQIEVKRSSEVISGEKVVNINFGKNAITCIVKAIDYPIL